MEQSELLFERKPPLAVITFNRPHFHNALTWVMYEAIETACVKAAADPEIRALVMRGAGDKAFASGTDITQFHEVKNGADGIAYERRVERALLAVEALPKPVIAAIEGYAAGAGAALAMVCDLRYAGAGARIGVPISRTVGNCLSAANYARMVDLIGPSRTKELLYRSSLIDAQSALRLGFVNEVVAEGTAFARASEVALELAEHAPITLSVTKEAIRRLQELRRRIDDEDLIMRAYSSQDFREGVNAFTSKRKPRFEGR